MSDPRIEYEHRLSVWRTRGAELDRRHAVVSNARLAVAGAIAVLLWLAFVRPVLSPWWPVAGVGVFLALIVMHARVLTRVDRARRAERLYARGLERLAGRWAGSARDGAAFGVDHPYARDLDLFGPGSLFELLNTSRTEAGEAMLAAWIGSTATIEEVLARQAAVDELRAKIDLREDLAVLAAETEVGRTSALATWAASPPAGLTRRVGELFAACGLVTILMAWLAYSEIVASRWLLAWIAVEWMVAWWWTKPVLHVLAAVAMPDRDLSLLVALLERIEREPFAAPRLAALRTALFTRGVAPSRRVAQLRRLVSWLDSTRNQLFGVFAYAVLLPQIIAVAIDRWHDAYRGAVLEWLAVVGELEALSALGTYAYEHPADPFPTLNAPSTPVFEAEALGHPLMPESAAVRNDVRLARGGSPEDHVPQVIVISGSNMSGKSTLLRAVGVNVVLALAGAPVRATRLRLSRLAIGATLRVEDSLQAGRSRFYAEILRIRDIVDAARGGADRVPLLFLLDEILHGTNSYDRRIGAEAVVQSLVRLGAIGLVTTHDLALTELPARLGAVAVNMHFEDRLEGGQMVFDYRMRPGVVEHSNALALMRSIGLEL